MASQDCRGLGCKSRLMMGVLREERLTYALRRIVLHAIQQSLIGRMFVE